ncbi:MAG: glycosyltransferase family 9 protein [Nitrospira sp.]
MEGYREDFTSSLILPAELARQGQRVLRACNWNGVSPLVLVHPGSGSLHKCVEAWRLAKLIEWLIESRMAPMLLEGPADCQSVAQVLSSVTKPVPVIRDVSLSAVAGVMAQANLYIGHDSGMTHLAAALAIPTIACFGPTQASRWAPHGSTVSIISGMPCVCVDWRKVEACQDKVCLRIPVESMIEASRTQLLKPS